MWADQTVREIQIPLALSKNPAAKEDFTYPGWYSKIMTPFQDMQGGRRKIIPPGFNHKTMACQPSFPDRIGVTIIMPGNPVKEFPITFSKTRKA
jgi:hypothetical protein